VFLNNLASAYNATGHYGEAATTLVEAYQILVDTYGRSHPKTAICLLNIAGVLERAGEYAQAEIRIREALNVLRVARSPAAATCLNSLATLRSRAGQYADAKVLYDEALDSARQVCGVSHPAVATITVNLACLNAEMGQIDEALNLLHAATRIRDDNLVEFFSVSSERDRLAFVNIMRGELNAILSLTAVATTTPKKLRAALDVVLRRKAIVAEASVMQKLEFSWRRDSILKSKMDELNRVRGKIAQETVAGPEDEDVCAHRITLDSWQRERDELEVELAAQVPRVKLEWQLRATTAASVASTLPDGSALVEFIRYEHVSFSADSLPRKSDGQVGAEQYLAFVLFAGDSHRIETIALGEAARIDSLITQFRNALANSDDEVVLAKSGDQLRRLVFDPFRRFLRRASRVFLSPDGDLALLPFEVLPSGDGGYLIDTYEFVYLSAGRDALRLRDVSTKTPSASVVVADPDYDLEAPITDVRTGPPAARSHDRMRSGVYFSRLQGTLEEGQSVAAHLGVRPLLGSLARKGYVKTRISPHILHIATHGFFIPRCEEGSDGQYGPIDELGPQRSVSLFSRPIDNPLLRSGLALAGANTWLRGGPLPEDAEDAILNGEDVCGMNLPGTELVVLSACETGLGDVHPGEGVFGLRRAFMLAGARTLIMSLWKVPDSETTTLMQELYQRLAAGESRAAALRQAQLRVRRDHPEPYYWGAFVCQGDPGPFVHSLATSHTKVSTVHTRVIVGSGSQELAGHLPGLTLQNPDDPIS
jgi:CHAT domain-containing protein